MLGLKLLDEVDLSSYPAIARLNRLAESLPPEYREELYLSAIDVLNNGADIGKNNQEVLRIFKNYLSKKAQEAQSSLTGSE